MSDESDSPEAGPLGTPVPSIRTSAATENSPAASSIGVEAAPGPDAGNLKVIPFRPTARPLALSQGARVVCHCSMCHGRSDRTEWPAHQVVGGELRPIEDACASCLRTAQWGFPLLSWKKLVALASSDQELKRSFVAAREVHMGNSPQPTQQETVWAAWTSGVRVEKAYSFLTQDEFLEEFGLSTGQAGVGLESLRNEEGEEMTGALLSGEALQRGRRVVVFDEHRDNLQVATLPPQYHLRTGQGHDFFSMVRARELGERPLGLRTDSCAANVDELRKRAPRVTAP